MRDRFRYTIAVDGIFGPQSEAVTRQFQQAQRIAVDGLVGPVTWGRAFG
jgi:peptidoglycan hydrolase-like protein with peptidoglycan-binding domain